jgi:hypothetical protein
MTLAYRKTNTTLATWTRQPTSARAMPALRAVIKYELEIRTLSNTASTTGRDC